MGRGLHSSTSGASLHLGCCREAVRVRSAAAGPEEKQKP